MILAIGLLLRPLTLLLFHREGGGGGGGRLQWRNSEGSDECKRGGSGFGRGKRRQLRVRMFQQCWLW